MVRPEVREDLDEGGRDLERKVRSRGRQGQGHHPLQLIGAMWRMLWMTIVGLKVVPASPGRDPIGEVFDVLMLITQVLPNS